MYLLTKLITAIILPPFNVLILWLLSCILAKKHCKKLSLACCVFGIAILYISSIPYTAQKLQDSLVQTPPLSLSQYKTAQAIVVLGGGLRDSNELFGSLAVPAIALERLRYAAYLHQQTQLPILLTGASPNGNSEAQIMANELQQFFHTPTQWLEEKAQTTIQNAQFTKQLLDKENIHRIILVTNQWHMQRAKLLFEKQGFIVLPASIGNGKTPESYSVTLMHFIPQASAMAANAQALKEWIGYWKEKI
ncbi:YdcF family protein [Avibacterium paragallinarum]|uniref:Inner membrane protein n=1 Tax=Avibacterium paragallinarum TaxID=728 RepID=A0A377IBP5_AVIPA|nr:YdcF family protein [Avibacterium paragallinarum]POY47016.1 hypothetical protein C3364_04265 [Avibacterium paragallinarum]RZN57777.1 YdcF family protein [Avibacterium paragallinarum]RZN58786.1 YdcF family protein [Avibacterium paragallinarum]RZN77756.1 YdcF family protein [Avibacterium paragallinarum]STO72169.1 inner membrane protein [Avibacterium paragallinarum]